MTEIEMKRVFVLHFTGFVPTLYFLHPLFVRFYETLDSDAFKIEMRRREIFFQASWLDSTDGDEAQTSRFKEHGLILSCFR